MEHTSNGAVVETRRTVKGGHVNIARQHEVDCVTKIEKNNKFKMAAAAILNPVYRS